MLLPPEEAELFFRLYPTLIGFAAGRLGGVEGIVDFESFRKASRPSKAKARDCLLDRPALIDEFVHDNPAEFREQDLSIVQSWQHFVRGDFVIERELKKHTVFLNTEQPPRAYGVLGLTTEIADMPDLPLPLFARAVLLPWKGQIICDGLITFQNVLLGSNIRRTLKGDYLAAKAVGIITSLDGPASAPAIKPAPKHRTR